MSCPSFRQVPKMSNGFTGRMVSLMRPLTYTPAGCKEIASRDNFQLEKLYVNHQKRLKKLKELVDRYQFNSSIFASEISVSFNYL